MEKYSLGEFEEVVMLTVAVFMEEPMVWPSKKRLKEAEPQGQRRCHADRLETA